MKTLKNTFLFSFIVWAGAAVAAPRAIQLETKKIGDAVHWTPEKVEVKAGEEIEITASHKLEGGFEFHGLKIPALNIIEQVNRNQDKVLKVSVPKDLKSGEYEIGCQFHPKHVAAKLVVLAEPAKAGKKAAPAKKDSLKK